MLVREANMEDPDQSALGLHFLIESLSIQLNSQ